MTLYDATDLRRVLAQKQLAPQIVIQQPEMDWSPVLDELRRLGETVKLSAPPRLQPG